jgi:hypothetical protein
MLEITYNTEKLRTQMIKMINQSSTIIAAMKIQNSNLKNYINPRFRFVV